MKKIVSFCLALLLTLSAVTLSAFAVDRDYDPDAEPDPGIIAYFEWILQASSYKPGEIAVNIDGGLTTAEKRKILLDDCARLYPDATETEIDEMVITVSSSAFLLKIKEEDMLKGMLLLYNTRWVCNIHPNFVYALDGEYDPELAERYKAALDHEREPGEIAVYGKKEKTEEIRERLLGVCAKLYPDATEAELALMVETDWFFLGHHILKIKDEDMLRAMLLLHEFEGIDEFGFCPNYICWAEDDDIVEYVIGDVNGDERVDVLDYLLVKRYYLETLPEEVSILEDMADYNRDGKIDFLDYLMIKKVVLAD